MRYKLSRPVEGRKLDAVYVIFDLRKQCIGQPVSRFPIIIARKTPVNVRFLNAEKTSADVHGIGINGWDHQNLFPGTDAAVILQLPQCLHQLGADIHLLDLISSGCSHDACRLFPLAELEALYMHIFSVSRMYGINISFKHNFLTPSGFSPAGLLHRPPDMPAV